MKRRITALLAAVALSLTLVGTVSAAKTVGTVTLDQASPTYGSAVTFSVTTNAETSLVNVACYQSGNLVLGGGGLAHHDAAYTTESTTLSSQAYTGGAADCTATLRSWVPQGGGKFTELASTGFSVAP